jgi:uncharacterized protein (DUF1697 family)
VNTFISLLRGVNVGGKSIRMADLKSLYEGLGFGNVRTYLQSGNVLFDSSNGNGSALGAVIEAQMARSFAFSTSVLVRTAPDLQRVIQGSPFLHGRLEDPASLHVTFLKGIPLSARVDALKAPEGETDEFVVGEQEVYLFCPNGYGRTKLSNAFLERKLDLTATTRNWKTVTALFAMSMEGR